MSKPMRTRVMPCSRATSCHAFVAVVPSSRSPPVESSHQSLEVVGDPVPQLGDLDLGDLDENLLDLLQPATFYLRAILIDDFRQSLCGNGRRRHADSSLELLEPSIPDADAAPVK